VPQVNARALGGRAEQQNDHVAEVLIINGPPGVGKTTVSRILADLLPATVCIRGDDLRAFAPKNAREHLGGGSTFRAAAVLAKTYLAMGAARIVVDYVFLRRSHVAHFRDSFALSETPVHIFTLWAPLHVVQFREQRRTARPPLGSAVEECWREIERNKSLLGEFVDATAADPADLARKISARIGAPAIPLEHRATTGAT
jgi:predicted kinase